MLNFKTDYKCTSINKEVKSLLEDYFKDYKYNIQFTSRRSNKAAPGLTYIDGELYLDAYIKINFKHLNKPVILSIWWKYPENNEFSAKAVYYSIKSIIVACVEGLETTSFSTFKEINSRNYIVAISFVDFGIGIQISKKRFQGDKIYVTEDFEDLGRALWLLL